MTDVVEFCISATPEVALKKLSRQNIPIYKLKKHGSALYFGVNREYVQKVFAIFAHTCYNVRIKHNSRSMRFARFIKIRLGLVVGAVAFLALAICSQAAVLRVKVTGSGSFMEPQIVAVANECGVRKWTFCRKIDGPMLQSEILALPGVNFCSVRRTGSCVIIDVQADESGAPQQADKVLKSPADGVVYRLVAVCGTPLFAVGDGVKKGDKLIAAHTVEDDGSTSPCTAVGFADICVSAQISLFYDGISDENLKDALASTALYSEKVIQKTCTAKERDGGAVYTVSFKYLITVAVNME